jgi:CMP-N,N'-diacetyllegionaminic acid synthase
LYLYSVEAALSAKSVDHIILSTDDQEIIDHAEQYREQHGIATSYSILERPEHLALDGTSTRAVVTHLIETLDREEPDAYVILQPTSPLRTGVHIDEAIELLAQEEADSVVGVQQTHHLMWKEGDGYLCRGSRPLYNPMLRPRRQDLDQYTENGAIFVFTPKLWGWGHGYVGGRVALYVMPDECSLEVDTPFDFWLIEQVMKHG